MFGYCNLIISNRLDSHALCVSSGSRVQCQCEGWHRFSSPVKNFLKTCGVSYVCQSMSVWNTGPHSCIKSWWAVWIERDTQSWCARAYSEIFSLFDLSKPSACLLLMLVSGVINLSDFVWPTACALQQPKTSDCLNTADNFQTQRL